RSIVITADPNKSPKTGSHIDLDVADLIDYDREEALSTVHEKGIEEDLKDPEIPSDSQAQPEKEVIELMRGPRRFTPGKGRRGQGTEATNDFSQWEMNDPMEVSGGDEPPPAGP
ncbi:MAG: hypothetical protein SGPRY_004623, partial [Prymnesium sp.]